MPQGLSMLSVLAIDPTGETYGFVDNDKNEVTHIATGVIKRIMAEDLIRPPVTQCMFGESLTQAFERGELGVEEDHAMRLPEEALKVPCLIGLWGKSHIMLDGAHRVWRRLKRGDLDFPAYVMPENVWREFIVYDVPGTAAQWNEFNRHAKIRTPVREMLRKAMGGL